MSETSDWVARRAALEDAARDVVVREIGDAGSWRVTQLRPDSRSVDITARFFEAGPQGLAVIGASWPQAVR